MIQNDVFDVLKALVGNRCYPAGRAPDNVARPFIAYQTISEVPDNVLSGTGTKSDSRIQVDVYADTYDSARTTFAAVKAAMTGAAFPCVMVNAFDLFEDDADLHRVSADFSIRHD